MYCDDRSDKALENYMQLHPAAPAIAIRNIKLYMPLPLNCLKFLASIFLSHQSHSTPIGYYWTNHTHKKKTIQLATDSKADRLEQPVPFFLLDLSIHRGKIGSKTGWT